MGTFFLAEKLGKYAFEVEQEMPLDEMVGWIAYFELKNEMEEKEAKRRRSKSKASRRGRHF